MVNVRHLAAALACAAACALAQGCRSVDPVIPVEGRRMVVIPFRDAIHYHYESPRGTKLARFIVARLSAAHEADPDEAIAVVPLEELVAAVGNDDPKDFSFSEVGRRTRADVVLLGRIVGFETRRRGDVGFLRGIARAEIAVVETARPEPPLFTTTIDAIYPPEDYVHWGGLPIDEATEQDIEAGLIGALGEKIARLFYAHEPGADERR